LALAHSLYQPVTAQSIAILEPAKDNTIFSESLSQSNGADFNIFAGTELAGNERRALLAFDLSVIPQGALVTGAELRMTMTRTQAGPVEIRVHRLLADWGEGEADGAMGGGGGAPASGADATWTHRFFDTDTWASGGGDFDPSPITTATVSGPDTYLFSQNAVFVDLVQDWIDGISENFGFILIADDELSDPTAKRFAARENPLNDNRPKLIVSYEISELQMATSGLWFDPALDGEGYNVIQSPAGTVVFFYGYTANGERLWLVSETSIDPIVIGEELLLELFRGQPGNFDNPAPSTQLQSWGSLSITLDSCTTGQFILQGVDGNKTANVVKLAGIQGTNCITVGR
jgi:hypothetical protein